MKPVSHYDRPPQRHVPGEIAPHGTATRYVLHKCRCEECRAAIQGKAALSRKRRGYGMRSDWEQCLVDASEAREHIIMLSKHGIGAKYIEKATGIGHTTLWEIRSGRRTRIFPGTRDRILGLTLSHLRAMKDRATVPAKDTLRLVDEMVAAGFAKVWIARQIGQRTGGLQIAQGRGKFVFVRTANSIRALHDRLWRENAEGFKGHRNAPDGKLYSGKRMREVCRCRYADDPEAQRRTRTRKAAA